MLPTHVTTVPLFYPVTFLLKTAARFALLKGYKFGMDLNCSFLFLYDTVPNGRLYVLLLALAHS